MVTCNQLCEWNYYKQGCAKPFYEVCPLVNALANAGVPKDKPTTNADRIRAMSDEELAGFSMENCPPKKFDRELGCRISKPCVQCVFEWLKQPAEEDT